MVGGAWTLASIGGTCASSWGLSNVLRRVLSRQGVIDIPNERSSHSSPVVRGVGAAIAIAWITGATVVGLIDGWHLQGLGALVLLAAALTGIGLIDDVRSLTPAQRLGAQIVACTVAVLGGVQTSTIAFPGIGRIDLGPTTLPLCVFMLVAVVNLFNFMDGIDGLAAGEAALAASVIAVGAIIVGADTFAAIAGCLIGATLGFLPFNWYPARCFMGDAGSYFCGGTIAGLLLIGQRSNVPLPLVAAATGPFFLDAIVTLLRRLARREPVWRPHRSHVYQRLVAGGWSHARVAGLYLGAGACLGAVSLIYLWHVT